MQMTGKDAVKHMLMVANGGENDDECSKYGLRVEGTDVWLEKLVRAIHCARIMRFLNWIGVHPRLEVAERVGSIETGSFCVRQEVILQHQTLTLVPKLDEYCKTSSKHYRINLSKERCEMSKQGTSDGTLSEELVKQTSGRKECVFKASMYDEYLSKHERRYMLLVDRTTDELKEEEEGLSIDKVLAGMEEEEETGKVVSSKQANVGMRVKIGRVEMIRVAKKEEKCKKGYVEMRLINGRTDFEERRRTRMASELLWEEEMVTNVAIRDIPLGVRLQFAVYMENNEGVTTIDRCLGWVNVALYDSKGFMRHGKEALSLWMGTETLRPDAIAPCTQNTLLPRMLLHVEFEESVYFKSPKGRRRWIVLPHTVGEIGNKEEMEAILRKSSMEQLTEEEKTKVWDQRIRLAKDARGLAKVAISCPWNKGEAVEELYELMRFWGPLELGDAIELLGPGVSDPNVRAHGAEVLRRLSDETLLAVLPHLVQGLKMELHHESALGRLLMERAQRNQREIGHALFWLLRVEILSDLGLVGERYAIMLESYVRGCGRKEREELVKEVDVMNALLDVWDKVKQTKEVNYRLEVLRDELGKLKLPELFRLPLHSRRFFGGLCVEKCKVILAKRSPLWLVFKHAEGEGRATVIFDGGKDMKEDVLATGMMRICDWLWKEKGMDLRMTFFRVMCLGNGVGLTEVIPDCHSLSYIKKSAVGYRSGFDQPHLLLEYFIERNFEEEQMSRCLDNFTLSCAACFVLTLVLGIKTMRDDKTMFLSSGHMFNVESSDMLRDCNLKFGINREREPLILREDFKRVIGDGDSERWNLCLRCCSAAFQELRRSGNMLITLLQMSLAAGKIGSYEEEDVNILRDALRLNVTDEIASECFIQMIHKHMTH